MSSTRSSSTVSNLLIQLLAGNAKCRDLEHKLSNGADPNIIHPSHGVSAMHLAAGLGVEVTSLMLQYGGDPNVQSAEGTTPLHVAASWGDSETLRLLLQNGSDINMQDQDGKTAYDLALEEGHKECVKLLKHHILMHTVGDVGVSPRYIGMFDKLFQQFETVQEKWKWVPDEDQDHHRIGFSLLDSMTVTSVSDDSAGESEVLSQIYSDKITEKMYEYLDEGRPVCFDATSPDIPIVGTKALKTQRIHVNSCANDPQFCPHHSCSENSVLSNIAWNSGFQQCHGAARCYNKVSQNLCHDCRKPSAFPNQHCHKWRCTCPALMETVSPASLCSSGCDSRYQILQASPAGHLHSCSHNQVLSPEPSCCGAQHNRSSSSQKYGYDRNIASSPLSWTKKSCSTFRDMSMTTLEHSSSPVKHNPKNGDSACHINRFRTPELYNLQPGKTQVFSPCTDFTADKNDDPVSGSGISKNIQAYSPFQHSQNDKGSFPSRNFYMSPDVQTRIEKTGSSSLHFKCEREPLHSPERGIYPKDRNGKVFVKSSACSPESDCYSGVASKSSSIGGSPKMFLCEKNPIDASEQDEVTPSHSNAGKLNKGQSFPALNIGMAEEISSNLNIGKLNSGHYFPPLNLDVPERDLSHPNNKRENPAVMRKEKFKTNTCLAVAEKTCTSPPEDKSLSLPGPHANPQERVAEFILAAQNFMAKCNIEDGADKEVSKITLADSTVQRDRFKTPCEGGASEAERQKYLTGKLPLDTSGSSEGTYATCCETDDVCIEGDVARVSQESQPGAITCHSKEDPRKADDRQYERKNDRDFFSKWKPPTLLLNEDDILTSDESFAQRARSPKIYRMKMKTGSKLGTNGSKKKFTGSEERKQLSVMNTERIQPSATLLSDHKPAAVSVTCRRTFLHPTTSKKRLSSDSTLSTLSGKEYIYRDKDIGITLIERHIPSEYGSSSSRRSIDSISSRTTVDSQATLIYDWRALKEVVKASRQSIQSSNSTLCEAEEGDNHNPSTGTQTADFESDGKELGITVPVHLEDLTCQEISQELQKYGEIPGPVIPATRQVYLRRLASLESNPGLVRLSTASPDYPSELRQALNGQFDSIGLDLLERNMTDMFNTSVNGRQWREGHAKSSFTYLLLDPRILNNLPLRARDMSEQEVFKTFICAIFYIGKGKRARPYSHLYEAVSKLNKPDSKMGAKVKHIIDIWNAGLGVVSLHCFQSVIPVEAYTREACMIEAIGVHKVTNMKRGDFYGVASTWSMQQRRRMGVYLLKKALQIFLAEGERQICVPDLKSSQ